MCCMFIFRDEIQPDYAINKKANTKQPLCMEQYKRIFNVYRRPGQDRDSQIVTDGTVAREMENIMVMIDSKVWQNTDGEYG